MRIMLAAVCEMMAGCLREPGVGSKPTAPNMDQLVNTGYDSGPPGHPSAGRKQRWWDSRNLPPGAKPPERIMGEIQ